MKALRISRTSLYSLIEKGSIKPIKIGGRTLFPETELTRFIEDLKAKNA
jgi:excisionase family DNA binding protein